MKCAINQPTYFPWLGYFDLIDSVDDFVFLDDVQIVSGTSKSWDCRNRIRTKDSELLLICPIQKKPIQKFNNSVVNDNINWRTNHIKSIDYNYRKTPYYEEIVEFVKSLVFFESNILSEININAIKQISEKIGISTRFHIASELGDIEGVKDERLVKICRKLKSNIYISPKGASVYIEKNNISGAFNTTEIKLLYQNYQPVNYTQKYNDFYSYLSIIDLLFNYGFDGSMDVIRSGRNSYIESKNLKL